MENTKVPNLNFTEFDEYSKEDWKTTADADLLGNPVTSLDRKPFPEDEYIKIEPYYSDEDLTALEYLQGFHSSRKNQNGWKNFLPVDNQSSNFHEQVQAGIKAGVNGIVVKVNIYDVLDEQLKRASRSGLEISVDTENPALFLESIPALWKDYSLKHIITRTNPDSTEVIKSLLALGGSWKSICISSTQSSVDLQLLDFLNNLHKIFQIASSMDMGSSVTSSLGKKSKIPLVGLGVVGKKTLVNSLPLTSERAGWPDRVIKAIE